MEYKGIDNLNGCVVAVSLVMTLVLIVAPMPGAEDAKPLLLTFVVGLALLAMLNGVANQTRYRD